MSQIDIRVLKQGIPSRKVITCCFFTVGEAYRSFNQYIGNLKRFVLQSDKLRGFEVRIYTDDTGKDIALDIAEGNPRVSVLHYDCPQFREGKGHMGMFGTLVRFLPLFEDLDVAWCSDIDIPDYYLDTHLVGKMVEKKCQAYISTDLCYDRKVWGRQYTIIANRFITRVKFPRALLTRYLNMITEGKLDAKIDEINKGNKTSHHSPKPDSKLPYGIDELFLNTYIYNWIINNNIRTILSKNYGAAWIIYKLLTKEESKLLVRYYYFPSKGLFLQLKKIIQEANPGPELNEAACYNELMEELPRLTDSFTVVRMIEGKNL
jgi:hypothetical protein